MANLLSVLKKKGHVRILSLIKLFPGPSTDTLIDYVSTCARVPVCVRARASEQASVCVCVHVCVCMRAANC